VENSGLRAGYFSGFDFTAAPSVAFNSETKRNQVIDPLLSRIMGANLASQPDPADIKAELMSGSNNLIDRLLACTDPGLCPNNATRTRAIVKASCAAVLGSAVTLLQ